MDARIVNYKKHKIEIKSMKPPIQKEKTLEISQEIKLSIPQDYIEFLEIGDKIWLKKNCIKYLIQGAQKWDDAYVFFLGGASSVNVESEIVAFHKNKPEFFPKNLLAFAQDGMGNYLCFDYREGKDNPNPPIVFWDHEEDIGKDVSFVAKDFETFIGMLRSDDELEN